MSLPPSTGANLHAAERLLPLIYDELRRLAAHMAREKSEQTLDATALVHEVYLGLVGPADARRWENRRHCLPRRRGSQAHSRPVSPLLPPCFPGVCLVRRVSLASKMPLGASRAPITVWRRNLNQTPRGRAAVPGGLIPSSRSHAPGRAGPVRSRSAAHRRRSSGRQRWAGAERGSVRRPCRVPLPVARRHGLAAGAGG
jgi:hypothetical protein